MIMALKLTKIAPKKALNKAFLKLRPLRSETTALEAAIDKMVYELFGLTEDEIKVVEGG